MAFTMFTSTKSEKIMKGQKRYYLLPWELPSDPNERRAFRYKCEKEREEYKKLVRKKGIRKTDIDMSRFG